MNESEAIAQLKRGDVRGLEVLVRKYQLTAICLARSITKDQGLAEEIVQEAFVRVYDCINQLDETSSFRAWLLRIVANGALTVVAQQRRLQSLEGTDLSNGDDLETILADTHLRFEQTEFTSSHESAQALQEILNSLPPKHRAVLELKYYFDMSEEEIALALNVPPGTVKSRLHGAKKKLRSVLEQVDVAITCE